MELEMEWIVYCTSCDEIERMKNGAMAEAAGRIHSRKTGHDVIVGYDPAEIEEECPQPQSSR